MLGKRGMTFFKRELDSSLIYKGGLARKKEVVFLRGVGIPMCTMRVVQNLKRNLFFVSKMIRIW